MDTVQKPSKQFIIRGAVSLGILVLLLTVQTPWFKSLFKKSSGEAVDGKTVGAYIAQDSNGNDIPDWEEKLWGLDPTVLYTNGVPNKQIIDEKKASLGIKETDGAPQNETDILARQLFSVSAALGQSEDIDNESLAAVGARLAESVEFEQDSNHYSSKDIQTIQTTATTLNTYTDLLNKKTTLYSAKASEMDILVGALETGDVARLGELSAISTAYASFAKELVAMQVPVGVAKMHLELANSIYGISVSLSYIKELSENGVHALAGIALYKAYDARLQDTTQSLEEYLVRYGILQ